MSLTWIDEIIRDVCELEPARDDDDDAVVVRHQDLRSIIESRVNGRISELEALINAPHTAEFLSAVRAEVAHQVERWGTVHDRAKAPADWLWLLGYLAGKAVAAHLAGDKSKALHHCVSSAAVLANWWAHIQVAERRFAPGSSDLQQFLERAFSADLVPA